MTIEDILSAPTGINAVSKANALIDSDPNLSTDVRDALHRRVERLVGPSAYAFTPRVANIWYNFYSESVFKLAALSLAASQDQSYPCEKMWETRTNIANKMIETYSIADIDFAMSYILRDWNHFHKFASDPHGAVDLVAKVRSWRPKTPKTRAGKVGPVDDYKRVPYVRGGKFDNLISMVREK